ncbi:MAG: DUF4249 domain-containing protein [Bacteroidota bacterium]|nr:DUF4249 domain-containing protein [Bacteroidota bacterium]
MKPFIKPYLISAFIVFSLFSSCKKVIDVSLKNSNSQVIIAGEINNLPGPYQVSITKSINFTENNIFPPVSGAFVTISSDGFSDTLMETAAGIYSTHSIIGKTGHTYSLYALAEGKVYTATSTMPQQVALDSIDFLSSRDKDVFPVAYFQDPQGMANYYQFIEYLDGERLTNGRGNFVFDDRLSDGRYISRVLYNDSTKIKKGTTVTVQMNCVDKAVYNYLTELLNVSGGGGAGFSSPTPANPTSNISGGALGYFSANAVSTSSRKVP